MWVADGDPDDGVEVGVGAEKTWRGLASALENGYYSPLRRYYAEQRGQREIADGFGQLGVVVRSPFPAE